MDYNLQRKRKGRMYKPAGISIAHQHRRPGRSCACGEHGQGGCGRGRGQRGAGAGAGRAAACAGGVASEQGPLGVRGRQGCWPWWPLRRACWRDGAVRQQGQQRRPRSALPPADAAAAHGAPLAACPPWRAVAPDGRPPSSWPGKA